MVEKLYEELEEAKAEIERLKCDFENKELIIKQLSTENDTLRAKANENEKEKQLKINALTDEAESLKTIVSSLQNKCSEAAKNEVKSPNKDKVLEGDDMLGDLEDRRKKDEDQLKWKVEQFKHLEEAHEKLRDQFRVNKEEWEKEKSLLLDELSKLQESLDDRQKSGVGFKNQLDMCKQALKHEESRRKCLEEEISEMKLLLENSSNKDGEGKTEMECSTAHMGEDQVATLRHSLRLKEMDYKDLEYKARKLEQDNQDLLASIKELQESHIRKPPTPQSQWAKLRSRLKSLEQTHKECSTSFKAKEAEWGCQAQKMTQELNRCSSSIKIKDQLMDELKKELEDCHSTLTQSKLQNEELSLMLQLMQPESSEAGSNEQSKEGGLSQLMEQLQMKNSSLAKAQADLQKEHEEKLAIQNELERYKNMLDGSSNCQLNLMETEQNLKEELQEVRDAFERIDAELTYKTNEGSELEFELQSWKSIAERLKLQLEESQMVRRELEASLIAQAEVEEMLKHETDEKDQRISNLEQQIMLFDQEIMIGEESSAEEMEKPILKIYDEDEQQEHIVLATELEEAILAHIRQERNGTQHQGEVPLEQSLQEGMGKVVMSVQEFGNGVCSAKENVNWQHGSTTKTGETIIEERSPFRELN